MNFWDQVLSAIQKNVSSQCFDTLFRPIAYLGDEKNSLHLEVPSESFKNSLIENYSELLLRTAGEIAAREFDLDISVKTAEPVKTPVRVSVEASTPASKDSALDPKYTFESFVVGESNKFAHAATLAVAERPAKAYNPLYLYGGTGLGKTHLMHAIGNFIQQHNPSIRLSYMSSERFMNEFVNATRYDRILQFRQKYRNIDVLLMDDIQFLSGKEGTQTEFFHTFNALYNDQKQIVIASDCAPKQISDLEERLHSRFEWGLTADIQPPDLETKLAILKKKAQPDLPNLSDDVALFIAGGIRSNVRELEGALTRLIARASLDGMDPEDIDFAYAKDVLKGILSNDGAPVSSDMVMRAVASFFALKPSQLKTKNNSKSIVVPRQIAMYICKELTHQSLPQIGKEFGGKHHTTVIHSIKKIESLRNKDSEISTAVNEIVNSIKHK